MENQFYSDEYIEARAKEWDIYMDTLHDSIVSTETIINKLYGIAEEQIDCLKNNDIDLEYRWKLLTYKYSIGQDIYMGDITDQAFTDVLDQEVDRYGELTSLIPIKILKKSPRI